MSDEPLRKEDITPRVRSALVLISEFLKDTIGSKDKLQEGLRLFFEEVDTPLYANDLSSVKTNATAMYYISYFSALCKNFDIADKYFTAASMLAQIRPDKYQQDFLHRLDALAIRIEKLKQEAKEEEEAAAET